MTERDKQIARVHDAAREWRVNSVPSIAIDRATLSSAQRTSDLIEQSGAGQVGRIESWWRRGKEEAGRRLLEATSARISAQTTVMKASTEFFDATIEFKHSLAGYHAQSLALGGEVARISDRYFQQQEVERHRHTIAGMERAVELMAAEKQLQIAHQPLAPTASAQIPPQQPFTTEDVVQAAEILPEMQKNPDLINVLVATAKAVADERKKAAA